jgi:hypothetical protein
MDPQKLFVDERLIGLCVYCGREPSTRDHVPSKILLDDPLPINLSVVPACQQCNIGFSLDEQYLACLLECVISGSTDPNSVRRDKVRRILRDNQALALRIATSRHTDESGEVAWVPELDRVKRVLLKLARGHAAYEYSEHPPEEPEHISFGPLIAMSDEKLKFFESPPEDVFQGWPELGSRAFLRAVIVGHEPLTADGIWEVVQKGRYRYSVSCSGQLAVRMVLSEYLACAVEW